MTKTINKVQKTTTTPNEGRLNQLKQLFPECLTEGEVDAAKIIEQLNICKAGGGGTDANPDNYVDRYHFTWAGKTILFASSTHPLKQR